MSMLKEVTPEVVALTIVAAFDGEYDDGIGAFTKAHLAGHSPRRLYLTVSDEEGAARMFLIDVRPVD